MRVIVTGPRIWTDWTILTGAFDEIKNLAIPGDITIIHGGADGLDKMADKAAILRGWWRERYLPQYQKYSPFIAPLMRNQRMVDSGADYCLAFLMECVKHNCRRRRPHWTHGTADCMERAEKAGIIIKRHFALCSSTELSGYAKSPLIINPGSKCCTEQENEPQQL